MKVLFLTRATLYSVYGGDTVQVVSTAKYLRRLGIEVDIRLSTEKIDYSVYDLLHIFNAIRPADALQHVKKSKKPFLLSTIYVDFSEYHKHNDTGIKKWLNRLLSPNQFEYAKAVGRWLLNGEKIVSPQYLSLGHKKCVKQLAGGAALLLPNSINEYNRFAKDYGLQLPYKVIYNGIDLEIFKNIENIDTIRSQAEILCVARIEGKKNQLNLIKALNNTAFQLTLIGKPAPNHTRYYEECKKIAAQNITFIDFLPQEKLVQYYAKAKVHVLPSWNETCGLSSLEAGYFGCNLVITDKGDTEEYFESNAWYCDPEDVASIYNAVKNAAESPTSFAMQEKIKNLYNWQQTALETKNAYIQVLKNASGKTLENQ